MKNKKAIFFDLDGTLLPVDLDRMFGEYFARLKKSELLSLISSDTEKALRIFNEAAAYMMQNEGSDYNDNVYFEYIKAQTGKGKRFFEKSFNEFYATAFEGLSGLVTQRGGPQRQIVEAAKEKGYKVVLATMPVFPLAAAASRLSWVGLSPDDFHYVSHYQNSRFLKPHPMYYEEILQKLALSGNECIMVGNNINEDMSAGALGFDVFLVTGYEIGEYQPDEYPNGDLFALLEWVRALPRAEENR